MTERSISPITSIAVFAMLVVLTLAAVCLSFLHLGAAGHLAVGLGIAAVQGGLVALFFMHLVRSPARTWLAATVGLFWLGILMLLIMNDYVTRQSASF